MEFNFSCLEYSFFLRSGSDCTVNSLCVMSLNEMEQFKNKISQNISHQGWWL